MKITPEAVNIVLFVALVVMGILGALELVRQAVLHLRSFCASSRSRPKKDKNGRPPAV